MVRGWGAVSELCQTCGEELAVLCRAVLQGALCSETGLRACLSPHLLFLC